MSLLSLLIALAVDRFLTAKYWQFSTYYQSYQHFFSKNFTAQPGNIAKAVFVLLPLVLTLLVMEWVDNNFIEWIITTFILSVCIGCPETRGLFKKFLQSAFRGKQIETNQLHQQLLTTKNLPDIGFGQALICLNYRYYIAIILFFIVFGAAGVLFYRLLTKVNENSQANTHTTSESENYQAPNLSRGCQNVQDVLFWLDWLPVRLCASGYMFVGHFSRALPIWIEGLFDFSKPAYQLLIDVAQQSEDISINNDDITSQPCLLVSLAKRNVLLFCALTAALTLAGIVN